MVASLLISPLALCLLAASPEIEAERAAARSEVAAAEARLAQKKASADGGYIDPLVLGREEGLVTIARRELEAVEKKIAAEEEAAAAEAQIAMVMAPKFRSKGGYQKTRWGMTQKEVVKATRGKGRGNDLVEVKGKVSGFVALTHYWFTRGRLKSVEINFFGVAAEDETTVFRTLASALIDKYGQDEDLESDRITGTRWETEDATITLVHDPYVIRDRLVLTYRSKEYRYVEDEPDRTVVKDL